MDRIVIIGIGGSGKSTLGQVLARRLSIDLIEPDGLYWEANWRDAEREVFRQRVTAAIRRERWIFAGNYSKARDLVWTRADTLIWLDYSFPLVFSRLFRRTLRRIVTQEDLWGTGNRESWRAQFLSTDSMFVWLFKTYWRYRSDYPHILQQPEYTHLQTLRFRSPRQTACWLETVR